MTFFHGIWMFVFWAIVIFVLFSLFKKDSNKSSLEILEQRLAKGEISIEEFEKLKNTLSKNDD
jgi:putative membrane protein